jgi:prenyltransferase beta subunit
MYKKLLEIAGKSRKYLSSEACSSILHFIKNQQNRDGGFCGRNHSDSDLYYSMFAILVNDALTDEKVEGLCEYIDSFEGGGNLDLIHLAALSRLYASTNCRVPDSVKKSILCSIEKYRSHDGGFHHIAEFAENASPYGTFLAYFTYKEFELTPPDKDPLLRALLSSRTPDGGFSNIPESGCGTTNATVAAIILLQEFHALPRIESDVIEQTKKDALAFLDTMSFSEGGFKAVGDAPLPDILSTATTLFAFNELNYMVPKTFQKKIMVMIEEHWSSSGGFFGNQADTLPDCEYTFYALLALGCLNSLS